MMNKIVYKNQIDGLRGIAILLVLLFHFFPEKFSSGFIGVDIFFVISGYLMTLIITNDIKNNNFKLGDFYLRRIKRLIPSILFVAILCFITGYYFLSLSEFKELSKELFGCLFFFSNFIFLKESGYFDGNSFHKPMLHFWSLGVEEQFYLIWPIFLIFTFRFIKLPKKIFFIFSIFFIISFLLNLAAYFKGDFNFDFYSPTNRLWEFIAGSIVSCITIKNSKKPIFYFGVSLLITSIFFVNNAAKYPGFQSLLPVIATSLIILSIDTKTKFSFILNTNLLRWIGKISFPLYLVHWPIIVFFILINGELTKHFRIPLLVLSFIVACFIHYLIEKPLRYSSNSLTIKIIIFLNLMLGFLVGITYIYNGEILNKPFSLLEKSNNNQLIWNDSNDDECKKITSLKIPFCKIYGNPKNITVAIIGDSTANHLAPGFYKFFPNKTEGLINLGEGSCPVILGLHDNNYWGGELTENGRDCIKNTHLIIDYLINKTKVKQVIMAFMVHDMSYWGFEKDSKGIDKLSEVILSQVDFLKQHGISTIVTFGSPYINSDLQICLKPTLSETTYCKNKFRLIYDDYLFNALEIRLKSKVVVFNQAKYLQQNNISYVYDKNHILILRDNHHYSYFGSEIIGRKLIGYLN